MFRKKPKESSPQPEAKQAEQAPRMSGGYQVTELPTFHGRKRKVVVYTSDGNGKIIKTFKK